MDFNIQKQLPYSNFYWDQLTIQQQNTKTQQELLHLIHTPVMKVPSNGRKTYCTEFELFYCFNVRLILIPFFIHSNDKNLCSKALLCGVRAFSKKDLESEVKRFKHANLTLPNLKTSTVPHRSHQTSLPVFGKLLSKCNMLVLSFTWHAVYMCVCVCVTADRKQTTQPNRGWREDKMGCQPRRVWIRRPPARRAVGCVRGGNEGRLCWFVAWGGVQFCNSTLLDCD